MSSEIPNEPGNRPARDYDRHIDKLNEGEPEAILDPLSEDDREFVRSLMGGLAEMAEAEKPRWFIYSGWYSRTSGESQFWGPDCVGYELDLERAGRYTDSQIIAKFGSGVKCEHLARLNRRGEYLIDIEMALAASKVVRTLDLSGLKLEE